MISFLMLVLTKRNIAVMNVGKLLRIYLGENSGEDRRLKEKESDIQALRWMD